MPLFVFQKQLPEINLESFWNGTRYYTAGEIFFLRFLFFICLKQIGEKKSW